MENQKAKSLNPFLETLGLIYMTKNFEAVKADMIKSLDEMNIDGNQFYKQNLFYLENYVHEFQTAYSLDTEEAVFFEYHTEFFLIITAVAAELLESGAEVELLDSQHIFSVMRSFLKIRGFSKKEKVWQEQELNTMEEWFAALQESEYAEDTRWRLLELFYAPVEKFQKIFAVYEKNRKAFDNTFQKNKNYLEKLISEAPSDISDVMHCMVTEFYPKQKKIYLTAAFPLIEWLTPAIIFQGVLADKVDLYRENMKNAKEMLPQILKMLGDKSKFEILCLLKSHGKYNLEIAEELQLTPATASHHMSMLLSNYMVTVEKKDGRVYYQLNQETLRGIIKSFEEIFL